MSQCIVPEWNNLRLHRQEQVEAGGEGNRSSQLHTDKQHSHSSTHHLVPMTNYEVAELTWENGQLGMHGHGGLLPIKPSPWCRATDTLESIVHQATYPKQIQMQQHHHHHHAPANISSVGASSGSKLTQIMKKRSRSERNDLGSSGKMQEEQGVEDRSACGSASATFCRETNATMMTWANSFESGRSLKTKSTDDDSACHGGSENQDEEQETKGETGRSHSMRRSRAAAIHNQSERRRRDRINQKMKALQKLVPNASKTDKASMLDEVIEYLKHLQAQIQMMSVRSSMPQMMMPLGVQQHLHMSALLARMGMGVGFGMGMGMLDMTSVAARAASHQPFPQLLHPASAAAAAAPTFVPPPFVVPSMIPAQAPPQGKPEPGNNAAISLNDPYCAFLAQSMNMELYNKMAELYRQQLSQTAQASSTPSQPNNAQAD